MKLISAFAHLESVILTARYAVTATSLFARTRNRQDVKRADARCAGPDAARRQSRRVATAMAARGCGGGATECVISSCVVRC
jgi:hypothetical protein